VTTSAETTFRRDGHRADAGRSPPERPAAVAVRDVRPDNRSPPGAAFPGEVSATTQWRRIVERPSRVATFGLAAVFVVAVVTLALTAWRTSHRLDLISRHVRHTARIASTSMRLQDSLLAELSGQEPADPKLLDELRHEIDAIRALDLQLDPETKGRLQRVAALLASNPPLPVTSRLAALDLVREVLDAEGQAQSKLLTHIDDAARQEFRLAFGVFAALLALCIYGWWAVRRRFLRPLGDLAGLLTQLGEGEFRAVHLEEADSLLVPLFRNYNYLVTRLAELEAEHRSRALTLEAEVRHAAHALLEQQRTLARAERLAALGEMAGSLAHELRNPLAGILMSLTNLRRDVGRVDLVERIDLASAEVERLTRMLNGYLSTVRHSPEPLREIDLHELVTDLLALVRYQVPEGVRLRCQVPEDLRVRLPRDRVRQALLNLVLNSVQAAGEKPVEVTVSASVESDRVVLTVADTGPGFPPELLGGWQPFATQREGGTGLGLAVVRRVALDLGGELRLTNRQPRGAAVHLSLPLALG
jgi:two-component system NtrC family sensor kinase